MGFVLRSGGKIALDQLMEARPIVGLSEINAFGSEKMQQMRNLLVAGLVVAMATWSASSWSGLHAGYQVKTTSSDFDSALFGLENAIVNRGLVIDAVGHVGTMLERTSKATGGKSPYINARYLGFCSAKLSAEAMDADPNNLAICPYVMFVYELKAEPGKARIGYRKPGGSDTPASKKASAAIEKLLADILAQATQ